MNEEQRIREEALLTDEEISNALTENFKRTTGKDPKQYFSYVAENDRVIAQAQLDKVLKTDGIEIRAEKQDLPEPGHSAILVNEVLAYKDAQRDMLKPDSEGNVWVKVAPKPYQIPKEE